MALTITDIANSALIKLGQSTVLSIDDATPNAHVLKSRIDFARRLVLRMHPWNCAIDRVTSAPTTSSPAFGFAYKHTIPSSSLRILSVEPQEISYRIEGRFILTDADNIDIVFIKDAPVSDIDDATAEAISFYLAWDCCEKITGSTEQRDRLNADFRRMLGVSKSIDAQEERGYEIEANLFVDSRIGGYRHNRSNR
jgi:hypothetical protein